MPVCVGKNNNNKKKVLDIGVHSSFTAQKKLLRKKRRGSSVK